jgi:hypothetical protein
MPLTIRRRCREAARTAGSLLAAAVFLFPVGRADAAPSPRPADSAQRYPILIDSLQEQTSAGKINLSRALELAAEDPRDNIVRFDPALLGEGTTITLVAPIVPPSGRTGEDRLEGPVAGGLVIDASACPDAGIIVGGTTRFSIANLIIRGGQQRAVLLKEQGRLCLQNVTLQSDTGPAAALFGRSRVELIRCRLQQAQTHGLEIHGDCTARLESVVISGCQQSGIAGFEQSSVQAEQCRLERNGHWNLVLTGSANAELEGCVLSEARFANADISETARLTTRSCVVENGQRFGVFATGQATAEIRSSHIRSNGSRGIEMQDGARAVLEASEVDSNRDYGLILFEECSIRAAGTKFTRNQGHGVSLRGQASGEFKICLFAGNRYSGLGCLDAQDGGKVLVSQCLFQANGMRPIYRGPLHLDPLVPTPLSIDEQRVQCVAEPNAVVELYLDRAGEASRYLKTIRADAHGRFVVNRADVPAGWVMGATATAGGSTSEFNIIAGSPAPEVMGALLARTGPLSDTGGDTDLDGGLRRWRPGTKLVLHVPDPPSAAVERYARFVAEHVVEWTRGALEAELCVGAVAPQSPDAIVVPVQYLPADAAPLLGRGGVTFMKWDAQGYFVSPMKILLATGKEPKDTCPRVLAHEFGHVLGLCHARVGLLSRMQGSMPPTEAFVNDFSPMLTFYDVLALHVLHQSKWEPDRSTTLRELVSAGMLPTVPAAAVASVIPDPDQPAYSPPAQEPQPVSRANRPVKRE